MKPVAFLLVDVGNSRVKWATSTGSSDAIKAARSSGEAGWPTAQVTPQLVRKLAAQFPRHNLVLASVVPRLTSRFQRAFRGRFHRVTAESVGLGFGFDYPRPMQLGADRLAVAAAAIVISCGTANAFSVLDAQGRFCGGAIAPGLQTQLAALLDATAQLPATKLSPPRTPLAKSTDEAIRAGVMLSFRGGVKEIVRGLSAALPGRRRPAIIITGGNSPYLEGVLEQPYTVRPLLVFEGLHIIGKRVWSAPHEDV
jgi:type III pantothenate kinase